MSTTFDYARQVLAHLLDIFRIDPTPAQRREAEDTIGDALMQVRQDAFREASENAEDR
jgi:hypothetical protein